MDLYTFAGSNSTRLILDTVAWSHMKAHLHGYDICPWHDLTIPYVVQLQTWRLEMLHHASKWSQDAICTLELLRVSMHDWQFCRQPPSQQTVYFHKKGTRDLRCESVFLIVLYIPTGLATHALLLLIVVLKREGKLKTLCTWTTKAENGACSWVGSSETV